MDFPSNNAIQDLLKQLKDINSKLQSVKEEGEEVNMDVRNCLAELDHRMMLLIQVDERLCDTLVQLDAVRQEKEKLVQQIRDLGDVTRTTKPSDACLSDMQMEEALLLEEEEDLKRQCEQLKMILKRASKSKKKGQDPLNDRETSKDSSQNVTAVKPGRKRVTCK
ncbi:kinesin-like protein KIN-UC [Electrophorus electricus]|uniref:kinesin-like protein KIN-UC n=1 Tax=Electrophorus electricus TaxID=8005 RepID=UPI0015CF87DE|nr:kinesin-like protein KIN-UC [Electrophorus electricus]